MASEKLGMVPPQHKHNGLSPHPYPHPRLVYQEVACGPQAPHSRSTAAGDPDPKSATRELTASFLNHHHFFQLHHQPPPTKTAEFCHQWAHSLSSSIPSGGESSEDNDVEDDDDNGQNMVTAAKINHTDANENFSTRIEEVNSLRIANGSSNDNNNSSEARNIGEEVYYAQNLRGAVGLSSKSGQKDIMEVENGSWNGRKKESCYASESQEPLRTILSVSDPLAEKNDPPRPQLLRRKTWADTPCLMPSI